MPRRHNKSYFIVLMFGIILTLAFMLFFYHGFSLLSLLNGAFMTGLFLVIFGAFFMVLQAGFFNGIMYGMKRFFGSFSGSHEYINEIEDAWEKKDKPRTTKYPTSPKIKLTAPLLIIGLFFFILSIVGSFFYIKT